MLGTRQKQTFSDNHQAASFDNARLTRDVGMSKRVVTAATFTASNARITGSNGDFAAFAVGDPVTVTGTNANNGDREVTAIDGTNHAFIVVDLPVKNEGPLAGVEIRAS